MNVSWNWLAHYVDLSGLTPKEVADRMTLASLEEEGIVNTAAAWERIIVARIQDVQKHPDADKLHIVTVEIGGGETRSVVCGGSNIAVGMDPANVPFAQPGAKIGDMEITETSIRGIISEGMLCGPDELGEEGEDERAIWILPEHLKPGVPLAKALGRDDVIMTFDVLANRPDCMGHRGIAREIAAVFNRDSIEPDGEEVQEAERYAEEVLQKSPETLPIEVMIRERDVSQRYTAAVISGVDTRPSPDWMQRMLADIGIRPINALVDVTNFMMFDVAQPFHAFDYDRIQGHTMHVRRCEDGEVVTTLDGVERALPKGTIIIEDKEGPMDVAGIMGGQRTAVGEDTNTILLQSAQFDAASIRKTSRAIGHRTDAVGLFEKGVSAHLTQDALKKAIVMMKVIFPEMKVESTIDSMNDMPEVGTVTLTRARLHSYLGTEIPEEEVVRIITKLGGVIEEQTDAQWVVRIPLQRIDIAIEEDLIEEVARIWGYVNIPFTFMQDAAKPPVNDPSIRLRYTVRKELAALGMHEVINYAFLGKSLLKKVGLQDEPHITVMNPIDEGQALMRSELLSGLLRNVAENLKHTDAVSLFEVGKVYFQEGSTEKEPVTPADERWSCTGVLVVPEKQVSPEQLYRKTRGILERLLDVGNIPGEFIRLQPKAGPGEYCAYWTPYHPGRSAQVIVDGHIGPIATLTEIHPRVLRNFGIEGVRIGAFTLSMNGMLETSSGHRMYKAYSVFPPLTRDVSIAVPEEQTVEQTIQEIVKQAGEYLSGIELFDVYRSKEQVGQGKKRLAFHLTFQSEDGTLKDIDVDAHVKQIESTTS